MLFVTKSPVFQGNIHDDKQHIFRKLNLDELYKNTNQQQNAQREFYHQL
jgi:hypothetical protein